MKRLSLSIFLFVVVVGGFFASRPVARAAFGISPPFLNADHLVAGATYQQTVYLVQDQPNEDLHMKATLSVPENIASWIVLDTGYDFVIPKGTRQFPVTITIHIPEGEALGKYNGNLAFVSQPGSTGQVTIALGVNVAINLTIGTGIFEQFSVPLVSFPDIEEGWNPKVSVKFRNEGNIPEAFDSATFEILDHYDAVRLAYIQKQDGFPTTPAFTTKDYTMEFPTDFHLGVGQYWGVATFYKDQKVVASQKTVFNVLAAGSILGPWGSFIYMIGRNKVLLYGGIVLAILIIISIIWFIRRRSPRHRHGHQA